ncbi:MAG: cellulase family glycosylhydrolase [Ruminococcus sp.]|nr:cellulase family glycosylhydrolase [Ruminococcus sp.]
MRIKRLLSASMAAMMLLACASCGKEEVSSKALEVDKKLKDNAGTSPAQVVVEGTEFKVGGQTLWINGVNTPWDKWNDFGGGFNFEFWQEHFSKLHEAGCNAARVWIICDGTTGIDISPDGTVNGATDAHWSDLDDLFFLAEQYQIYIMATVQSFDCFKDQNANYQAWRDMVADETKTQSFIDNYIVPFVQRYDKNDYLWSIDLCNEPDWIVENDECGKLSWDGLQRYYAEAAAAIHENSDVLVTVGLGMIKYNSDKQEGNKISDGELQSFMTADKYDKAYAYVDFYSVHWYSWMQRMWGYPFSMSPEDFGLDGTKPAVIGECPAVSDGDFDIAAAYEEAYDSGWNGVQAWKSSGQDDGCGLWADIEPAITKMADKLDEKMLFPTGKNEVAV